MLKPAPIEISLRQIFPSETIILKSWHKLRNKPPAYVFPFKRQSVGTFSRISFLKTISIAVSSKLFTSFYKINSRSNPEEKTFFPVPKVTKTAGPSEFDTISR